MNKNNGPGSTVLHTKAHGNRSTGFKEENFMAFNHIWARKPSGHVTNIISTYFHFIVHNVWSKKVKWFLRKSSFNFNM